MISEHLMILILSRERLKNGYLLRYQIPIHLVLLIRTNISGESRYPATPRLLSMRGILRNSNRSQRFTVVGRIQQILQLMVLKSQKIRMMHLLTILLNATASVFLRSIRMISDLISNMPADFLWHVIIPLDFSLALSSWLMLAADTTTLDSDFSL